MTNNTKPAKGFTLIETLVAVLILMTAIAGPLTITFKGFTAATVAKDQVTAYFLAQDAIEFIRFARDTNRLASATDWLDGGGAGSINMNACKQASGCAIDTIPGTVAAGSSALRYNSTSGSYNTTGTGVPIFTRITRIITVAGNTEVIASTTVTWSAGGVGRSVTIFETLLNWQ